jgi:hypothetical protein
MLLKIVLWGAVVALGLLWLSRRSANKRVNRK